jgi:hypothetical protein
MRIMGYDVHITRAPLWWDSKTDPIDLEEWAAYIRFDPEMRLDGVARVTSPQGETIEYRNPGLAVWTVHSSRDHGRSTAWFDCRGGKISVKNPDRETRKKMHKIATKLGAQVQGDDGESYGASGEPE